MTRDDVLKQVTIDYTAILEKVAKMKGKDARGIEQAYLADGGGRRGGLSGRDRLRGRGRDGDQGRSGGRGSGGGSVSGGGSGGVDECKGGALELQMVVVAVTRSCLAGASGVATRGTR